MNIDSKNKNILVVGEVQTQALDNATAAAEAKY